MAASDCPPPLPLPTPLLPGCSSAHREPDLCLPNVSTPFFPENRVVFIFPLALALERSACGISSISSSSDLPSCGSHNRQRMVSVRTTTGRVGIEWIEPPVRRLQGADGVRCLQLQLSRALAVHGTVKPDCVARRTKHGNNQGKGAHKSFEWVVVCDFVARMPPPQFNRHQIVQTGCVGCSYRCGAWR